MKKVQIHTTTENTESLYRKLKLTSAQELYHEVAVGYVKLDELKFKVKQGKFVWPKGPKPGTSPKTAVATKFVKPQKKTRFSLAKTFRR